MAPAEGAMAGWESAQGPCAAPSQAARSKRQGQPTQPWPVAREACGRRRGLCVSQHLWSSTKAVPPPVSPVSCRNAGQNSCCPPAWWDHETFPSGASKAGEGDPRILPVSSDSERQLWLSSHKVLLSLYLNSSRIFQSVICLDAVVSGELKSSLISLLLFVLRKPALVSSGNLQRLVLFVLFFNTENQSVSF